MKRAKATGRPSIGQSDGPDLFVEACSHRYHAWQSMTPPALPLGSRRRVLLASATLAFAAVLASACTGRGSSSSPSAGQAPKFEPSSAINVISEGDAPIVDNGGGDEIVVLFTDWYREAFVDPGAWSGREFPKIVEHFTGQARAQISKEIASVTLGSGNDELQRVEPGDSSIAVTVYVDRLGTPTYAIADVKFAALGTLRRRGLPLTIRQDGVYYLRRESGVWKIFSYRTRSAQAQNPAQNPNQNSGDDPIPQLTASPEPSGVSS